MEQITPKDKNIEQIESHMLKMPQAECPVIHTFGPGVYIRELRMKAGTLAIGHYQKTEHLNAFISGEVLMINDDGSKTLLKAPMLFTSKPGRKIGHVLKDMVWLNIYATTETDIEKLEDMFFEKSEEFKEHQAGNFKQIHFDDNKDFNKLISEYGYTNDVVREQSENTDDIVPLPHGSYKFKITKSNIEGRGAFATANISTGELIGQAKIGDKRTVIGRYVNHSKNPNSEMVKIGNDIFLKAITNISGCHGGQDGEELTTNYRLNLKLIGVKPCQE